MNFYKRYMADYGKKTARLTLAQHGAYTLLLDEMYSTEEPLPAAMTELFKICRAMSKVEQDAVRLVADKHFPIGIDGLRHNERAAEELLEAAPAVEAARLNGKKGGRPKKETQQKPSGFPKDNPGGTQREPSAKPPHSSDTSPSLRSGDVAAVLGVTEKVLADYLAVRKAKRAGPLTDTAIAGIQREADLAGITLAEAITACCEYSWQGFNADWYAKRKGKTAIGNAPANTSKYAGAAKAIWGDNDSRTIDA